MPADTGAVAHRHARRSLACGAGSLLGVGFWVLHMLATGLFGFTAVDVVVLLGALVLSLAGMVYAAAAVVADRRTAAVALLGLLASLGGPAAVVVLVVLAIRALGDGLIA